MSLMSRCSLAGLALLAAVSGASAQEELIGGGVFRAPTWSMPIMSIYQLPGSGTAQAYGGQIGQWGNGSGSTSATARQVPIPVSGYISGLTMNNPAAESGSPGLTVTTNINGTDGTVTCANPGGTAPFLCNDGLHQDGINAGDLFVWHFNPNGTTWAQGSTYSQTSAMITTTGQAGAWLMGPITLTLGASVSYVGPFQGTTIQGSVSTENQMSAIMPIGGTITGLFVTPNSNTGTDPWIATICQNGTTGCSTLRSGIYCQPSASATTGCCASVNGVGHVPGLPATACGTATAMTFAAGDTISVQFGCPGSAGTGTGGGTDCPGNVMGVGIAYVPTGFSQAILTAQGWNNNPAFVGNMMNGFSASQNFHQITPQMSGRNMVFGNLTACTGTNPGGSGARVFTAQTSAGPPTLPTNTSVAVTMNAANGACLGANSGTLLGGARDNVSNWVAGSLNLVDIAGTSTGSPVTGNQIWKLSTTAAIQ